MSSEGLATVAGKVENIGQLENDVGAKAANLLGVAIGAHVFRVGGGAVATGVPSDERVRLNIKHLHPVVIDGSIGEEGSHMVRAGLQHKRAPDEFGVVEVVTVVLRV